MIPEGSLKDRRFSSGFLQRIFKKKKSLKSVTNSLKNPCNRFQFQWILKHGGQLDDACDASDANAASGLYQRLKNHVISLACGNPALGVVQSAAQATLQQAWSLLLPTPEERATALATLLHR